MNDHPTDDMTDVGRVRPMEVRGRQMQGWLRVDDESDRAERQLERWVRHGVRPDVAAEALALRQADRDDSQTDSQAVGLWCTPPEPS